MDYLTNVRFDKALMVEKGLFVHNYCELLTELRLLSDTEFNERFNNGRVIIKWIRDNYNDEKLLSRLEIATKRREFMRLLEKRINHLEEEKKEQQRIESKIPEKRKFPIYVNVIFFATFILVIFAFLHFVFESDKDSLKSVFDENAELKVQVSQYSDRIIFLEKQNLALKDELSLKEIQILPLEAAKPTPRDRIKLTDIVVDESQLIIRMHSLNLAEFTDTGSMLPVLGSEAIGIQMIPQKESEIYPGDVISYILKDGNGETKVIIHRVLEVGYDSLGWYAVTKGDNNPLKDKDKVRFSQVERVLVGVLY